MTYDAFLATSKTIHTRVDEYNTWGTAMLKRLLTDIAPRIAAIGEQHYCGCGFHYAHVRQLAELIDRLAIPWHVDGNHCEDYESKNLHALGNEVVAEMLIEGIIKAESCIQARAANQPCRCHDDVRKEIEANVKTME